MQAPIKKETEQMTLMSPVSSPPLTIQPSQPTAVPPNAHPIPVPIINVYMEKTTCTKRTERKRQTLYWSSKNVLGMWTKWT